MIDKFLFIYQLLTFSAIDVIGIVGNILLSGSFVVIDVKVPHN